MRPPPAQGRRVRGRDAVFAPRRRRREVRHAHLRGRLRAMRHPPAVLARGAGGPPRPGLDGSGVHAHHQAGLLGPSRRRGRRAGVRARAVHLQAHHGEALPRRKRDGRQDFLRVLDELAHHCLQGYARRDADARLFPRPRRRLDRDGARARPLALLHEHDACLGARASQPLHRAQRRDKHPARQRELDARPRAAPVLAGDGCRP